MFRVPFLVVLPGLTLCILLSHNTMARQFSESDVVHEAARNKIGLIRYCRNNELLHPGIADEAIRAVETLLRELPPSNTLAGLQGGSTRPAGEDGVQDAGRRDEIDRIADLFRTTPADLCQEWASDTLWGQAQRRYREVKTIAVVTTIQPDQLLSEAGPTPVEPIKVETIKVTPNQVDRPPAPAPLAVRGIRAAPPPLPERARLLASKAELASLQRTSPAGGGVDSASRDVSGPISGTTTPAPSAAPQSSGQAVPLSVGQASEAAAAGPPDREQAVAVTAPSRRRFLDRLGKRERCLMPGCKWSAPQEKIPGDIEERVR